jgi:hypothetical protein
VHAQIDASSVAGEARRSFAIIDSNNDGVATYVTALCVCVQSLASRSVDAVCEWASTDTTFTEFLETHSRLFDTDATASYAPIFARSEASSGVGVGARDADEIAIACAGVEAFARQTGLAPRDIDELCARVGALRAASDGRVRVTRAQFAALVGDSFTSSSAARMVDGIFDNFDTTNQGGDDLVVAT